MSEEDTLLVLRNNCRNSASTMLETTELPTSYNLEKNIDDNDYDVKKSSWYNSSTSTSFFHHLCLFILGLLIWGLLWAAFGDDFRWDGPWFRIAGVGVVAWISGKLLQSLTTLPPVLAALLTGIFAQNMNILDMRDFTHIDAFLRKIYPVLVLGKGSLAWDLNFMKENWQQVAALGVLPWSAEVVTMTICTNQLLGFPCIWGVLLGSVYASISCPVIMPSVQRIGTRAGKNWPQIICTAGGTDTALSVGVYGLVFSYIFSDASDTYRYTKVSGVAVLVCNATAATYWKRNGWKLNNNAASTTYHVLWATAEPMVFAYTGTFFVINQSTGRTLLYGLAILAICLFVRLGVAALVCWDMTLKERIFVCCTWSTKSVVEAVLCPVAINALLMTNYTKEEMGYAEDILRLLVEAILITTPIAFCLTHYLGPWLLKEKEKDDGAIENQRKISNLSSPSESINQKF